jgi:hypothetical protein
MTADMRKDYRGAGRDKCISWREGLSIDYFQPTYLTESDVNEVITIEMLKQLKEKLCNIVICLRNVNAVCFFRLLFFV